MYKQILFCFYAKILYGNIFILYTFLYTHFLNFISQTEFIFIYIYIYCRCIGMQNVRKIICFLIFIFERLLVVKRQVSCIRRFLFYILLALKFHSTKFRKIQIKNCLLNNFFVILSYIQYFTFVNCVFAWRIESQPLTQYFSVVWQAGAEGERH